MRAVAGVQVRFATSFTGERYVTDKLWERATIASCPWHPQGGCGFARHGTYERVTPVGCRVARWYCRKAGATVSALPDCLAAHRRGTLDELESLALAAERATSLAAAARTLRGEIELPGALRYLGRLRRDIQAVLAAVRGLDPARFVGVAATLVGFAAALGIVPPGVLMRLRTDCCAAHLATLPVPLGFVPYRIECNGERRATQQRAGRDPPRQRVEACASEHTRAPSPHDLPCRARPR